MKKRINEIQLIKENLRLKEKELLNECLPRLDFFCCKMSKIENLTSNHMWSLVKFPSGLISNKHSHFDVDLTLKNDKIVVNWKEFDLRSSNEDERENYFEVHEDLFQDDYENYVKKECEKYKEKNKELIENNNLKKIEDKKNKIERLNEEINSLKG